MSVSSPSPIRLHLPLVFVGLPGAGKSKVGRLVAAQLGVSHVDTDDLIEKSAGKSISQIFMDEAEQGFRQREIRAVHQAVQMGGVISLGGGAVTSEEVRDALRDVCVVHIHVEHDELVRRVTKKTHRPLLREDPDGMLRQLRRERLPLYEAVETIRLESDDGPASEVADRVVDLVDLGWKRIHVGGDAPYDVCVGHSIPVSAIAGALRSDASKVLIVHAQPLETKAREIANGLETMGFEVGIATHPDGEAGKSLDVVARLWDEAGRMKLGRADAVIAIGGGATTDMAGFVAATWLRGIGLINIPTTLLAMVDAAVGGKTGINSSAGKNLIGCFHPPLRVIVDLDYLSSLPEKDFVAGLGEVVKCGFIRDTEILRIIEGTDTNLLSDSRSNQIRELIERAIVVKADVVSADLKESGLREILNYGHTLAHAIEKCENFSWRHGEAVSVGCVFAAHLGVVRGLLTDADVERHINAFSRVGLPVTYSGTSFDELLDVMLSDKKVRAGQLRFVLLDGIGNAAAYRILPDEARQVATRLGIA